MRFLNKTFRWFLLYSGLFILGIAIIIALLVYSYKTLTIVAYNKIILTVILLFVAIILMQSLGILLVFLVHKKNKIGRLLNTLLKLEHKVVFPIVLGIANVLNLKNKDSIRKLYIDINNNIIKKSGKKYCVKDILLILPHCLQNSQCNYKVTNNANNCKNCGRCCLGEIIRFSNEKEINLSIVTGGTAARQVVKKFRPKLIIAVACERDLVSGIIDLMKMPVIGVLNTRPFGPCNNTCVDLSVIKGIIQDVLK